MKSRWLTLLFGCLAALVLAAAEPPADFTVPRVGEGRAFTLSAAKGRYVALHFLLKTECPLCLRHTRGYLTRAAEVPGVEHVFLKPDPAAEIQAWAKDLPAGTPLYRDADAALAKRYGVPDGYQFHGQTVHYPALILLDPAGKEVFRHVGKDNGDRYAFDDFAAKLKELRAAK
jgi:thioredoxin-dependent peroxiredoxin